MTRRELVERLKEGVARQHTAHEWQTTPIAECASPMCAALSALNAAPKAMVRTYQCALTSSFHAAPENHAKSHRGCPGPLHALIREEDAL